MIAYKDHCPFTAFYVHEMLAAASDAGVPAKAVRLAPLEEAKNVPSAFCTMRVFYNGDFLSHEVMSKSKMGKLLDTVVSHPS